MKRKLNPVILVGALLALAGVAFLAVLASRGPAEADRKVQVLVASAAVAPGTPASGAGLQLQERPTSDVPAGAVPGTAAVAGQVALRPVAKGEVVVAGAFGPQGVAAAGGVVLPPGKEGMGVELGFAPGGLRYVVPGNRITVWATPKGGGPAKALLRDVQVIATTPGAGDGAATPVTAGPGNLNFLLALARAEAEAVISAQSKGASLYFTLARTGQGR